ncbi:MAG: alpha/beta hydrolase [Phycisphaerales bacterium]|nr:alpha/beta hydrolase [Phycisphaerales bacterium]
MLALLVAGIAFIDLQGRYIADLPVVIDVDPGPVVLEFDRAGDQPQAWLTSIRFDLVRAPLPQVEAKDNGLQLTLPHDLGGAQLAITVAPDGALKIGETAEQVPLSPIGSLVHPVSWGGEVEAANGDAEPLIVRLGESTGARIDLPSRGILDYPVQEIRTEEGSVSFSIPTAAGMQVVLTPLETHAEGALVRGDKLEPVRFVRDVSSLPERPQEPLGQVAWTSQSVTLPTRIETSVKGTLTLPPEGGWLGKPPLVLLIPGRGRDRDGLHEGHRPLMVLAHRLAQVGVASIRFDTPGVGESDPWPVDHGPLTSKDLSLQVSWMVEQLAMDERFGEIVLAGIGDGAMTAALTAARVREEVQGVILLSMPALPLAVVEGDHISRTLEAGGIDPEPAAAVMRARLDFIKTVAQAMHEGAQREAARTWLLRLAEATGGPPPSEQAIDAAVRTLSVPGRVEMMILEPRRYLPRITAPVLGIWGLRDEILDGPVHADIAQESIESLGGTAQMHLIPLGSGMLGPTPLPRQGASDVRRTFLPEVLTIIEDWVGPPEATP